jgi:hypothetical protein
MLAALTIASLLALWTGAASAEIATPRVEPAGFGDGSTIPAGCLPARLPATPRGTSHDFTLTDRWGSAKQRLGYCPRTKAAMTVALDFDPSDGFDPDAAFVLKHGSYTMTPAELPVGAYVPPVPRWQLTVDISGSGAGQVDSLPSGLACASGRCSASFYEGTELTLTALPQRGSVFLGWSGACGSGTSTATLALTADTTCGAHFMPTPIMPETGWWWSPGEPGSGYSIELRNGRLFYAAYLYRSDGSPVWYIGQGAWDGYALSAELNEFADGQTLVGTWRPAKPIGSSGMVTLTFASSTRGTIAWSGGARTAIERFRFNVSAAASGAPAPTASPPSPTSPPREMVQALRDSVVAAGTRRVIVRLHGGAAPSAADRNRFGGGLRALGGAVTYSFRDLPMIVATVTPAAFDALLADPEVAAVQEDRLESPLLTASTVRIGADRARAMGAAGSGQTVAVLDTGVDADHSFLAGRVVAEACFSSNDSPYGSTTTCPNGATSMVGPGSGRPCSLSSCRHGTHVAGIAAGAGTDIFGVAPQARVQSVQVFSYFSPTSCGALEPCVLAFSSDIIRALEHVRDNARALNVAAVNLSLGGGSAGGFCDHDARKPVIDQLRARGVATIAAAGNDGTPNLIGYPACISSAIAVGATDNTDAVASFSSGWALPMLMAPGVRIQSSVPGGGFAVLSGTSMATPHVAGAWAVLRARLPGESVDTLKALLVSTAASSRGRLVQPRIDLGRAAEQIGFETGWWWSANEPGRGFFIEVQSGTLFLSGYMFGEDGRASWYVASGPIVGGLFQGSLTEFGGGQAAGGPWRAPAPVADHGKIALRIGSSGTVMLTLPNGRELALTRFSF